jgi:hypothetical protein
MSVFPEASRQPLESGPRTARIWSAVSRLWSDPLSRGGLALLVNTAVTGILGFGYWLIAARLFSTYAVGVAGALVAAATLFSGIGQLNLSGMLMRFLPTAEEKSRRLADLRLCCVRIGVACGYIPDWYQGFLDAGVPLAPRHD